MPSHDTTPPPPRPSFDRQQDMVQALSTQSPQTHLQAKASVSSSVSVSQPVVNTKNTKTAPRRCAETTFRCMLTSQTDYDSLTNNNVELKAELEASGVGWAHTKCCHVFPESSV